MLCLNGQTFSSRTGKTSGLPKDRIMLEQVLVCTAVITMLMVNPAIAQQNLQTIPFGTPSGNETAKKMAVGCKG
jgi:hypothetical protein